MAGLSIIALGYILFGMTGFGASLITIPVLSHVYPVPFVLALAALLDLGSALILGVRRDGLKPMSFGRRVSALRK